MAIDLTNEDLTRWVFSLKPIYHQCPAKVAFIETSEVINLDYQSKHRHPEILQVTEYNIRLDSFDS